MAYTNASVQAMIAEFGDRISSITFDNGYRVYIGYPSQLDNPKSEKRDPVSVNDLEFKTFGGTEVIGVKSPMDHPAADRMGATVTIYHNTELIQHIVVRDEICEKYGFYPSVIRY